MAARLVTIYWRDIPAQVTAQQGRTREKALLDARFQHAIDRAAMVAGCSDSNTYIAEWRRETRPCDDDLASSVAGEAARIDAEYSGDRLERLVRAGGIDQAD
mgnify:CR=1 FL=1|jgi:hypothetical protein